MENSPEKQSARSSSYLLEDSIGFLAREASRAVGKRLLQHFETAGHHITLDQWLVLVTLHANHPQNQHQIGDFCNKDRATVTRLLDSLEQRGYILRSTDPADRRHNFVSLTSDGIKLTESLISYAQQTQAISSQDVTAEELAICKEVLRKVARNLADAAPPGAS